MNFNSGQLLLPLTEQAEMAKEDASVAINNALQKLDQQPNLVHKIERLKSLKSNLQDLGSRLGRINSIPKLTQVREVAYDAEDAMDDAIMAATASLPHKRWRKLGNALLFYSQSDNIIQQIEDIEKRTVSIAKDDGGGEDNRRGPSSEGGDEVVEENMPAGKDVVTHRRLFYLSLSGFPADVEVSAQKLIQIWVAKGFLDPQGSRAMEEQGREQINWLLNEGFITAAKKGTCGNIKTFKIEQDKLEACVSAAKTAGILCVKFYNPGENSKETGKLKALRLAIHTQITKLLTGNNLRTFADHSKVRSLQNHCTNSSLRVSDYGFLKAPEYDSLWVLNLGMGCLELETVPEAIGKLVHLRYLRLRAPKATKIPASICNLPNLQTIDLKETTRVKTMPVEIWKMKKNLRHLHLGGSTALPPPRRSNHYDALQNLQTLCGVRPDKELKRLMVRAKFPNVNRLRLQCASKNDSKEFLSFLKSLDLLSDLRSLTLRGPIEDFPTDWNAFPSSMTKMTLSKTLIPAGKGVKTLEKLPNLMYLKLMEDSVAGEEMKCAAGRFPALQVLRMKGLKLKSWKVEKGAMRLLADLVVSECEGLERVEAIQPSQKLGETLDRLQIEHGNMTVDKVYPPPAEPNGTTTEKT